MTEPAPQESFAAILDEALGSARDLRARAEDLAQRLAEPAEPQAIHAASTAFGASSIAAGGLLSRLVAVLRDADHHTLESAWEALCADPARAPEAEQMAALIRELKLSRATIARSEQRIEDALLSLDPDAPRHGEGGLHAEA